MKIGCECGEIVGHVANVSPKTVNRAKCYCRDCQAAAFLGDANKVLDEHGGTQVCQTIPALVSFEQGIEKLQCIRLSKNGLMRWRSSCCNTPIANTLRDHKFAFVGVIHTGITHPAMGEERDKLLGPCVFNVNTQTAINGPIKQVGVKRTIFKVLSGVMKAKLTGSYKQNPFFDSSTGDPIVEPRILSKEERAALYEQLDSI